MLFCFCGCMGFVAEWVLWLYEGTFFKKPLQVFPSLGFQFLDRQDFLMLHRRQELKSLHPGRPNSKFTLAFNWPRRRDGAKGFKMVQKEHRIKCFEPSQSAVTFIWETQGKRKTQSIVFLIQHSIPPKYRTLQPVPKTALVLLGRKSFNRTAKLYIAMPYLFYPNVIQKIQLTHKNP